MAKLVQWIRRARLAERILGIPGMWDDLDTWKKWGVKGLATAALFSFRAVRGWFVASGSFLDWIAFGIGGMAVVTLTVIVIYIGRKVDAKKLRTAHGPPVVDLPSPRPTLSTEWLSRPRALHLIGGSEYFRYLAERPRLGESQLARLMRLAEGGRLSRDRRYIPKRLLQLFAEDCPDAVRDGTYDRAALEGWLQSELDRRFDL